MIDLELDPAMQTSREMIKWLGKEKLRPIGIECDRNEAPPPPDHPFFMEFTGGLGSSLAFVHCLHRPHPAVHGPEGAGRRQKQKGKSQKSER